MLATHACGLEGEQNCLTSLCFADSVLGMKRIFAILLFVLSMVSAPTWAANYNKGFDALINNDYDTALGEFVPLANQGVAIAQHRLGEMYEYGQGVRRNEKTALKWYTLAAEQGFIAAQTQLGVIYQTGWGADKNYTKSVKWFKLAAEQGDDKAQYELGAMYHDGLGVIVDYVYAHMWMNIAGSTVNMNRLNPERDRKRAKDALQIIQQKMTSSQIEKAQDLARECVAKSYKGC